MLQRRCAVPAGQGAGVVPGAGRAAEREEFFLRVGAGPPQPRTSRRDRPPPGPRTGVTAAEPVRTATTAAEPARLPDPRDPPPTEHRTSARAGRNSETPLEY